MPRALEVEVGSSYGRLVVLGEAPRHRKANGASTRQFHVRCICGTEKTVRLDSLNYGTTVSCGCFHREDARRTALSNWTKHGQSKTLLYGIWLAMKGRCYDTKDKRFANYGGRGIKVCDQWMTDFEQFRADVGARPDGHSLDRINNDGDYTKENVRWATAKQQANNRRARRKRS